MSRASLRPPCFAAFPAAEACDVAARSGETGDETQPDRVSADAGEDDRDRRRGASCRQYRNVTAGCHDQTNLAADEIGGQCGQPIIVPPSATVFDRDVLSLDVAGFTQSGNIASGKTK